MDLEATFQAVLTQASDLEVGEAIEVEDDKVVSLLIDALITLYPDRTFHMKRSQERPFLIQISRVMYVQEEPQ